VSEVTNVSRIKGQSELASVSTAVEHRLWKQPSQVREFAIRVLVFTMTLSDFLLLYPGKRH